MPQVPAKAARFASFGRYLGALRPRMSLRALAKPVKFALRGVSLLPR
jgi:hypothetical protein